MPSHGGWGYTLRVISFLADGYVPSLREYASKKIGTASGSLSERRGPG